MFRTYRLSPLALVLCASNALAATYTVGNGPGCNYADVQTAIANAAGAGPHLLKLRTETWTDQNISVAGKTMRLVGGYTNCADANPTGTSILSGAGGAQASVFTITGGGNDVILESIAIIRGDETSGGTGGGIDFRGDGTLTLRHATISQNYAGYGGGINVAPGVGAELVIESGTFIQLNVAQASGGGIRLEGNSHLTMDGDDTIVLQNEALGSPDYGYGGGIEVISPATADIGSPGYNGNGVIYANIAKFGGGISINGNESESTALVNLYSVDPSRPVRIQNNRASEDGGGIFLQPYIDINDNGRTELIGHDVRIDGNRAPQGSAIFMGTDFDGVLINLGAKVFLARTPACSTAAFCSTITDNINENMAGQATDGAMIFVHEKSDFSAYGVEMRRNHAGQLVEVWEDESYATLNHCLIADNNVFGNLLLMDGGGSGNSLHLNTCTIAGNVIGGTHTISVAGNMTIGNSIVHQPGKTSLMRNSGTLSAENVIASDTVSLGGGSVPTLLAAEPRFVDPAHGDYHLQAASAAVDFANNGFTFNDLDGVPRGVDLDRAVNRFGPGDLGAYERQDVGNLVRNRGFIEDLRLWDVVTANTSTWQPVGKDSAGAVLVSKTMAGGDLVGLSQCVRIPGPGTYRLTGFGYGVGADSFSRDRVTITWKLRANTGGESCTGVIAAQGELPFPSTATWSAQVQPEYIDVSVGQWTRWTAVELALVVREGSFNINATTSGYFDGIVLEPSAPFIDAVFADGYE